MLNTCAVVLFNITRSKDCEFAIFFMFVSITNREAHVELLLSFQNYLNFENRAIIKGLAIIFVRYSSLVGYMARYKRLQAQRGFETHDLWYRLKSNGTTVIVINMLLKLHVQWIARSVNYFFVTADVIPAEQWEWSRNCICCMRDIRMMKRYRDSSIAGVLVVKNEESMKSQHGNEGLPWPACPLFYWARLC